MSFFSSNYYKCQRVFHRIKQGGRTTRM